MIYLLVDIFQRIFAKNQIRIRILKSGQIFITFRIVICNAFQNRSLCLKACCRPLTHRINSKNSSKCSLNANSCETKPLRIVSSVDAVVGNSFDNLFREIRKSILLLHRQYHQIRYRHQIHEYWLRWIAFVLNRFLVIGILKIQLVITNNLLGSTHKAIMMVHIRSIAYGPYTVHIV